MKYPIFDFFKTKAQICVKFFLGGLLPSLLKSAYYTFFYGILGNFVLLLVNY